MRVDNQSRARAAAETHCSRERLTNLALYADERQLALSVYFSCRDQFTNAPVNDHTPFHNFLARARALSAHREYAHEREARLALVAPLQPEIESRPGYLRILFASSPAQPDAVFELPLDTNIQRIAFGRYFELLPLVRAEEEITPYVVALVEKGRARQFLVRGEKIEELLCLYADVHPHAERERTGWPHHVDANAEERLTHFFDAVATSLAQSLLQHGAEYIIIECRDPIWSQLQPHLAGIPHKGLARFEMPGMELSAEEIVPVTRKHFRSIRHAEYDQLWRAMSEESGGTAIGKENVITAFNQSRVKQLFLGAAPQQEVLVCAQCGDISAAGVVACRTCGSGLLYNIDLSEALLRKALLSGADIVAPAIDVLDPIHTLGALLRY